ncbi:MAG TPA: lamin tail domain-containing protein [Candidatus Limnocylindria bacterium]|nr:lamin tail domain-containing protein [Candidatus Limnocylindria bacterium]
MPHLRFHRFLFFLAWTCLAGVPVTQGQILSERFSYSDGEINQVSGGRWGVQTAGTPLNVSQGAAIINQGNTTAGNEWVSRSLSRPFSTASNSVAYVAFNATWSALPVTETGSYFLNLAATTNVGTYYGRVGASIDGAAEGKFRISVANANWSQANTAEFPTDLSLNITYNVVARYDLNTGNTTLWIDPVNENSPSVTATDPPAGTQQDVTAINLRQGLSNASSGAPGIIRIDDLFVGANFNEVAAYDSPKILQQPVNTTVMEGRMAVFAAQLKNPALVTTQWRRNGLPLAGGTNATLNYGPVTLSDDHTTFNALLSNRFGTTNTTSATLTVTPDLLPPALVDTVNLDSATVMLTFSEPLAAPGALQVTNYLFSGGVSVLGVTFGTDPSSVILATSPLTQGTSYSIALSQFTDRAQAVNRLPAGTVARFTASDIVPAPVGASTPFDSVVALPDGGYSISSSGAGAGGTADQFQYAWKQKNGDFDQKVRVERLTGSDVWAQGGLMVRESLNGDSRFAAVLATPSLSGVFFESRAQAGTTAIKSGGFPVNYPLTWLRIRRLGNTLTGYASYDGLHWTPLASATLALPASVYVGLSTASHSPNQPATALFHDLRAADGETVVGWPQIPVEPLTACTRKTPLVISEIMYHAPARPDGKRLEFVELFNSNPWPEDLGGYQLAGDVAYTFPAGTSIPGGGFLVVAKSPADFQSVLGLTNVWGPYRTPIPATGVIQLLNDRTRPAVYLDIPYRDLQPWSDATDGSGFSLVLKRPSYGEGYLEAWGISGRAGGSPGMMDAYRADPAQNVVINELLAHPGVGEDAYIELYNRTPSAVDLSGYRVTDWPGTNILVIPTGTSVSAGGFLNLRPGSQGFQLDPQGANLYLQTSDGQQITDVVRYEAQESGIAAGRYPDGSPAFDRLQVHTPGSPNAPELVSDIAINELMSKPLSGEKDDQYIELYNRGTSAVDLGGWKFIHGVTYTFPAGTTIQPDGYLVVARNIVRLATNYPGLAASTLVGNFSGSLSGNGEKLTLARPLPFVGIGKNGQPTTSLVDVPVDEVIYRVGGHWGHWSDRGGSSLELRDAHASRRFAANWADSDESTKATWTTIEATSRLDLGATQGSTPIDRVEILMSGEGECLIDNIEVVETTSGTNRLPLASSTFESGLGGWIATGDHIQSSLESSGGFGAGQCLHVRATDRGDTMVNHLRAPLSPALSAGQTVTLRAKVRWLKGFPELVLRIKGNYAEATGHFNTPTNPGTPGAPNSQRQPNAGPAMAGVTHWPPLPATQQPVTVSARISDPDGVSAAVLEYRIDPSATYTSVAMNDRGTDGDEIAGDGIYSAVIPGQPAGNLVSFHVRATDASPSHAASVFPEEAPARECLVRFGDPAPDSAFGTYRLWVTQASSDQWNNQKSVSNERHDATFVYGNTRVVYNVDAKFAGSPYHQGFGSPVANTCHYAIEMPGDDQVLGATSFNKIHAPGNGPWEDDTLQREQTAYWMVRQLGLPWNNRRYVNFFINGNRRQPAALMEDTQTPASDVIDEHFPNDNGGDLFKLQPWFEFADNGQTFDNQSWCTLNNYLSGGVKKVARYRPNYLVRSAKQTANDYSRVFELIDTTHLPSGTPAQQASYVAAMDALIDTEEWLRTTAVEHAVGNWDSFLNRNGQNMYAYKPTAGPWTLYIWDYNIVLGGSSDGPTGDNLFQTTSGDSGAMGQFFATPVYRRAIWRAYDEIANRIMAATNVNPIIDAKYASFQAEGVAASSPSALKNWIKSRQTYLLGQLKSATASFAVSTGGGANFATNQNPLTLTGTAPVSVKEIEINGTVYPVTWTDFRHWQLTLPLGAGVNSLALRGLDRWGRADPTNQSSLSITYNGNYETLTHQVVINEIMYHPAVPGAEFIELYNTATNTPYDLSSWRLEGVDYIFPEGATLSPGAYLVLARDRKVFADTYGTPVPVADVFGGFGSGPNWTLKLVKPGTGSTSDTLVNGVRFRPSAPWPSAADGTGASLQLIDPGQDNVRVANWATAAVGSGVLATPGRANSVAATLPPIPPLWINEVVPENLTALDNFGEPAPVIEIYNQGPEPVDLSSYWITDSFADLNRWPIPAGTVLGAGKFLTIWADGQIEQTTPAALHANFPMSPTNGSVALVWSHGLDGQSAVLDYLDYASLGAGRGFGSYPDGQSLLRRTFYYPTPGASNNPALGPNPIFINEWMSSNTHTITNAATGLEDDWFELYNAGNQAVNLTGFRLASPATDGSPFTIPPGFVVPPYGHLMVWADKVPAANGSPDGALHVNFHLSKKGTSVALFAPDGSGVDRITFGAQSANVSGGRAPDGGDLPALNFTVPTPGSANIPLSLRADFDLESGQWQLSLPTQPGLRYRVVFKDSLAAAWKSLVDFTATEAMSVVTDPLLEGNQRYYAFTVEVGP